ncbi:general secretion pathway protein GspN [Pseudomonas sp. S31]|uniref:general secretion pathway protein GspN n=1 Tax=Pseudomonas sp. S31 TaxID=1564473 RepID=UPI0019142B6A|nr:general secretion pathway protein GspN [Pseudomonas sp. S31]MBK5002063.1 general secretion pathway protein GspN [Pseudomonas sp. S31]
MKLNTSSQAMLAFNLAALAALAWVALSPVAPHWLPPADVPRSADLAPSVALPEPPQAQLAKTWTQPLFSPDRQPDPQRPETHVPALSDLALTGVMMGNGVHFIYLREAGKPVSKLALGQPLDNGWTLTDLDPTSATFTRDGKAYTLNLPRLRLAPPSKPPVLTLPRTTTP